MKGICIKIVNYSIGIRLTEKLNLLIAEAPTLKGTLFKIHFCSEVMLYTDAVADFLKHKSGGSAYYKVILLLNFKIKGLDSVFPFVPELLGNLLCINILRSDKIAYHSAVFVNKILKTEGEVFIITDHLDNIRCKLYTLRIIPHILSIYDSV